MSTLTLGDIIETLEELAAYDGPWLRLRKESGLLRRRVAELRERETRLDDVLVVALVGGSGVGKSTLLNALAGDTIAKTSEMRPCTASPTVYHPPGVGLPFHDWTAIARSALEHLVVIDTPDSDTIVREHRERVIEVLRQCDLILLCGSAEKYLDEATWSLLRPLRGERAIACVETKAYLDKNVRAHWLERLREQGFEAAEYFRVNALRSLDRKLQGGAASEDELDFPRLEQFLSQELSADRIARIKRSNAAGLLGKTVSRLHAQLAEGAPLLDQAEALIGGAESSLTRSCVDIVDARLFEEPHLWSFALRREMGLRAKGMAGTLVRFVDSLVNLPARIVGWLPSLGGGGGRGAAIVGGALFHDDMQAASAEIASAFASKTGEVRLALAKAGFDLKEDAAGAGALVASVNDRVAAVLRGPARDALVAYARTLTSWPVMVAADAPLLFFLLYFSYVVVTSYFGGVASPAGDLFGTGFLSHSLAVIAILVAVEVIVFGALARLFAWAARQQARHAVRLALSGGAEVFGSAHAALRGARGYLERVEEIATGLAPDGGAQSPADPHAHP